MSDGTFKHITVTAAEEDDVVIHAGLPSSDYAEPENPVSGGRAAQNTGVDGMLATEGPALKGEPATTSPILESTPSESELPAKTSSKAQPRKTRDDGYRPTTLDDLQGNPMPTIQRAVIIAAIVCIIGAIIYYIAFMG